MNIKKDGVWNTSCGTSKGHSAKCKICTSTLKETGGSTEELYEHLKRLHSCNVLKRKADDQPLHQPENAQLVLGP